MFKETEQKKEIRNTNQHEENRNEFKHSDSGERKFEIEDC
jgi:hypothetical protein